MKKKDRTKIIKGLFDELRKDIVVKNEMQSTQLEYLKRMELNAIEKNTDGEVGRIKKFVHDQKNNIKEYPTLRVRSPWINDKFIVTKF